MEHVPWRGAMLVAALALAGCGTGRADVVPSGDADGATGEFVGISSVLASDVESLSVPADPLPTARTGRCATSVRPRVGETEGEITVYVGRLSGPHTPCTGCELAPRPANVRISRAGGERRVTDAF